MKVRKGFVSNSSSSSFVCDLRGEVFESYDGSTDTGAIVVECENGHIFFFDDDEFPLVYAWVERFCEEQDGDDEIRKSGHIPERICPICQGDTKAVAQIIERIKNDMRHCKITAEQLK